MDTQGIPQPTGTENTQAGGGPPPEPSPAETPSKGAKTPELRKHGRLECILVGALISFVGGSLLYGPANVAQGLLFATICTAGIGLLLILAVCWMIGWVALEVWDGVKGRKVAGAP